MRLLKDMLSFIWEVSKIVIIAAMIVVPIRYFLFQPFIVRGQSMETNFANSDYLIVDEISYRFRAPQRGEVMVFNSPIQPSQKLIKRLIGLPNETIKIENNRVIIFQDNQARILDETDYLAVNVFTPGNLTITLQQDEYFVLGDNRGSSLDSRKFGPVKREDIIGRVFFRAFPFANITKFTIPIYE